jgi:radical SAM protein with 4Fe4S-binding SPASM domain
MTSMSKQQQSKMLSISEELKQRCLSGNIPYNVLIELTHRCNLACKHCLIVSEDRHELGADKIKNILDQLIEAGTFFIGWTGGEIFIRSDCCDILEYARERGFFQILLTNGVLIDEQRADFIKSIYPVGIEISLLGANPKTHDSITQVSGSFEKTVRAIRLLVQRGMVVYTKTTLMTLNIAEYGQIKNLSESLGAIPKNVASVLPKINGVCDPQQYTISWQERVKFLHGEALSDSFIPLDDDPPKGSLICRAGRITGAINPYGDVTPCVVFPVVLGNLTKQSFRDIWHNNHNQRLKEIRELSASDLEQCTSCSLSAHCVRCMGAAYLEHKNFRFPASSCCEEARWRQYQFLDKKIKRIK